MCGLLGEWRKATVLVAYNPVIRIALRYQNYPPVLVRHEQQTWPVPQAALSPIFRISVMGNGFYRLPFHHAIFLTNAFAAAR